jgi:hypothetical protein
MSYIDQALRGCQWSRPNFEDSGQVVATSRPEGLALSEFGGVLPENTEGEGRPDARTPLAFGTLNLNAAGNRYNPSATPRFSVWYRI